MLLTVNDLRREFGLEEECKMLFHNPCCLGVVHVYGTFGKNSLTFKFDNKIDYFEFLVEAKNLIENNIWREISFTRSLKRGIKETNKTLEQESLCLSIAIKIEERTQEILNKYVEKENTNMGRKEILLQNILTSTKECLLNMEQLGKLTNLL